MSFEPGEIPSTYYRVSVKALIFDDQRRLLVCRDKFGEWEVPGGGWEHDESLEECVVRELAEEVLAKVVSVGPLQFCYRGFTQRGVLKLSLAVEAQVESRQFTPTDDNLAEARFVSKDEFTTLPFQKGEASIKEYVDKIWPNGVNG